VLRKRETATNAYTEETAKSTESIRTPPLLTKTVRILIVDDDEDITTTFKIGLENSDKSFQVYTCNDSLEALSEFKPNFYDLLLVDINMPKMDGFELCEKILKLDINVRACFMSAGEVNQEAFRDWQPMKSIGYFLKKPISISDLVERLNAELD
jgi:DNA-binding response OmpR family regulator